MNNTEKRPGGRTDDEEHWPLHDTGTTDGYIEYLRMENEKLLLANHDCEKLVIEDMRAYVEKNRGFLGAAPFLDAYAKDRGIE